MWQLLLILSGRGKTGDHHPANAVTRRDPILIVHRPHGTSNGYKLVISKIFGDALKGGILFSKETVISNHCVGTVNAKDISFVTVLSPRSSDVSVANGKEFPR